MGEDRQMSEEDAKFEQRSAVTPPDATYGLPAVITVEETAEFLRLNVKTLHAAIASGKFPGRRVQSRIVVLRDAMLEWLRSPKRVPPQRRKVR
jgi:hypothetical protein